MSVEHGGGTDPARSLALLWRTQEKSSRRGKPATSVDRIARAAIELADTDGLAALSMRAVARHLGVGTMSLYTYVPGKSELVDLMADTVYGELETDGAPAGEWRVELERAARQNRDLFLRHAWLLQVSPVRPVLGPNTIAKYDYELRAVAGIGLTEVEMDAVVTLMVAHAESSARAAVAMAQAERRTGLSEEQWWSAAAPLLDTVLDSERFLTAAAVGQAAGEFHNAAQDPDHTFAFGLERIMDGIESLIRRRAGGEADAPGAS